MPYKLKLLTAGLVACFTHDVYVVQQFRHKAAYLEEENEAFKDAVKYSEAQIKYLVFMLETHQIPVTEFDLIALNNPIT